MLELTIRLVVSLAIVVGLLLLLARVGQRKFRGSTGAMVQVVHRQALSRTSAVAVVSVGSRVLVLGTTEQQISVLAELDPDEVELPESLDSLDSLGSVTGAEILELPRPIAVLPPPIGITAPETFETSPTPASAAKPAARAPGSHRARARTTAPTVAGPLNGSILSPQTWRQAFGAVTTRSTRGAARRAS